MRTILVSGASGVVGYGILKSLRETGHRLLGTSIYADSIAPAFCDIFELAPPTNAEHYINWLCGTIDKHKVDMIIPGIEVDVLAWSKAQNKISSTGTIALLNSFDLINLCSDKWQFYESLKTTGSKLVIESRLKGDFEDLAQDFGVPFLLKPRRSYASKGIVVVDSEKKFKEHQNGLGLTLMAQPIVGSKEEEYTVSAFFDKDSNFVCSMGLKRKLSSEGFTEKAQVVKIPEADQAIKELAGYFHPVGPTNFQFRFEGSQLKLLEINPRISSATSIRAAFGYNESRMSVEYFLEGKLPPGQPRIRNGSAIRYIEERIFYDSDNI